MEKDFEVYSWDHDGRIVVRVDKDLEDLIPEYLELTHGDVETLRNALNSGDLELVYRIGHTLKGSGGGYGFDGITEIGRNIEQLAKSGSGNEIGIWIGRLAAYLERVDVVVE